MERGIHPSDHLASHQETQEKHIVYIHFSYRKCLSSDSNKEDLNAHLISLLPKEKEKGLGMSKGGREERGRGGE
jgi:hypothetical protein